MLLSVIYMIAHSVQVSKRSCSHDSQGRASPRLLLAQGARPACCSVSPPRGAHSLLMMNPVFNCIRSAVVQSIISRSQSAESGLRVTADQVRSAGGDAESETGDPPGRQAPKPSASNTIKHAKSSSIKRLLQVVSKTPSAYIIHYIPGTRSVCLHHLPQDLLRNPKSLPDDPPIPLILDLQIVH